MRRTRRGIGLLLCAALLVPGAAIAGDSPGEGGMTPADEKAAEVYLDLVSQVPFFTDVNESMTTRVDKAVRALTLVVADEPEVAAACTTALLGGGSDPAVRTVRDRIGGEIHKRIRSAVGPDADPRVVSALEMAFFGALVNAGSGAFTYHEIADRLTYVVGLILTDDR